jgi:hypothetical protein
MAVRDALGPLGDNDTVAVRFDLPAPDGVVALSRTHPAVAGLGGYVLDTALDSQVDGHGTPRVATRCGVMRTAAVARRTTLLLCRFRVNLVVDGRAGEHPMLAEEAALLAFSGAPDAPLWLDAEAAEALLSAEPAGNVAREAARDFLSDMLAAEPAWRPRLDEEAQARAAAVAEAHERVRAADRRRGARAAPRLQVSPQLPVDVIGVYVFLPPVPRGAS